MKSLHRSPLGGVVHQGAFMRLHTLVRIPFFPDIHSLSQRTNNMLPLQATNLVGYFNLPPGFACAFVGGWMFAFPTLLSVFYSCCIALNSQLYFVFRREPSDTGKGIGAMLKWYLFTPIVVSGIICKSRGDSSDAQTLTSS